MEEYSRPATLADLKALIGSLNRQGAEYPLIGGYALFAHGYHRATTDIDVLVPATRQAGERIKAIISRGSCGHCRPRGRRTWPTASSWGGRWRRYGDVRKTGRARCAHEP